MTDQQMSLLSEGGVSTQVADPGPVGNYKISKKQLMDICHLDNHHADPKDEMKILSSGMIQETYGGLGAIAEMLGVDTDVGLIPGKDDSEGRKAAFGNNEFPPGKIRTLCELILENFNDRINQILLGASVVAIITGLINEGWPKGLLEGVSIQFALCIIIVVSSGNNYISEQRLAKLVKMSEEQEVTVQRGSKKTTVDIDYQQLLVGDVVLLSKGEKVPADCLLIEGQNFATNEVDLTGEPDDFPKDPITADNFNQGKMCTLMAKSTVVSGFGRALVVAVGYNTTAGAAAEKTGATGSEQTELQKKLTRIADTIGNVGYMCAALTFTAIVVRIIIEYAGGLPCGCMNITSCEEPDKDANGNTQCEALDFTKISNRVYAELLKTIITAITVIVVAIPEGLPLAVTIALSFASAIMQKQNNLVRKLSSAETMGQVTHICSDKTGTLTQNKMTTMAVLYNSKSYSMTAADADDKVAQEVSTDAKANGDWDAMCQGIMWNSTATPQENPKFKEDPVHEKEMILAGNVTECGILGLFLHILRFDGILDKKAELTDDKIMCLAPFDSAKKKGGIVVKLDDENVRFYSKGAPDFLFDCVTHVKCGDGVQGWDDAFESDVGPQGIEGVANGSTHREIFDATVKMYAKQSYRTILVCYKDFSMAEFEELKATHNNFAEDADRNECLDEGLTALCLYGLQDPLRREISGAMEQVKAAGITTIMCTGDNITTAVAISKDAGIVDDKWINQNEDSVLYSCMTGKNFREKVGEIIKYTDEKTGVTTISVGNVNEFQKVIKYLRVLGRSSPDDKYLLVTGLQQTYHGGPGLEQSKCSVAVTGDGTNDAPALSKANVGFAMGITGTDVAKNACDIVLLDDNFASIITALKYGRSIYDNVRKFLQFQLTVNIVAMFIVFFGSFILNDPPLTAVQMLWVNLIMDTFAALALASEPPDDGILARQPQPQNESIVTLVMWRNVWGHGVYQIAILILVMFCAQGILVEKYDIRCFKRDVANHNNCRKGHYNAFFTMSHYFIKDTKKWWEIRKDWAITDFDQPTLGRFNCFFLQEEHPSAIGCDATNWEAMVKKPAFAQKATDTHRDSAGRFLPWKQKEYGVTMKLIHLTFLFQIFVFMQVFNQLNARLLKDKEFNIFSGICRNPLFLGVTLITIVIQCLMVYFGGHITKTYPLDLFMNGICLAVGAGELFWGLVVKLFPKELFGCVKMDERPMTEEEEGRSLMVKAKGGTTRQGRKKTALQETVESELKNKVKARILASDAFQKMQN